MLEEVRITGLGVIDDVVLEPSPGLTVVTGETGAGKTMVVTGLGLLFGGRGDPARVRPGSGPGHGGRGGCASTSGRLHVAEQVGEAGGELELDGGPVPGRQPFGDRRRDGRARVRRGGRAVPVSLLTRPTLPTS